MIGSEITPRLPRIADRLAARERPAGYPVMYQQWRDLLFLHWEYPADVIQATLPEGLFVDLFEERAYLGIVPFFMRNIRPRRLPAVPGISNFMELNLRTYVHDGAGVPGVWFYSLDVNQPVAVAVARRFFHLPYQFARMEAQRGEGGKIRYQSRRAAGDAGPSVFEYAPGAALPAAAPGTLEFFLVERYRLYSLGGAGLRRGAVAHPPYPLAVARLTAWDEELTVLDGFRATGRAPDHLVMSAGVDVEVFPLERA
jgi:uncharacterized protein YqjF (DUF2071 family)